MLFQDSKQQLADEQRPRDRSNRGFTIPELLVGLLIATVVTASAIPVYNTAMANMRMNSMVTALTRAVSNARYQSVMTSQIYTLAITTPANTYVVKNIATGVSVAAVQLPTTMIAINGGSASTYTFTLCPNGTVYGAGGGCPNNNTPPALALTYHSSETDLSISGVGNVTSKVIK